VKIEHIAYMVEKPVEVAAWYCRHLGFTVKRSIREEPWTHFLADERGFTVLEIYNNRKCRVPDYRSWDPLLFHIAFVCADIPATMERLKKAGATVQAEPVTIESGDTLAMLRDPWGLCIQLAKRAVPMLD
jgi:glyoxylase I family protein